MGAGQVSGKRPRPAYVAIARSFVKDLRYRRPANRPLTHIETILWLVSEAAWTPRGVRTRFGAIHNERAQLSTTHRALANEWAWSKGKVGRWLAELARDNTIALGLARCGAKSGAEARAETGYRRTLITLLNYDKFNAAVTAVGRKVGHKVGQNHPELPGLIYAVSGQPTGTRQPESSFKKRASRGGGFVRKPLVEHGKCTRDGLFIFWRCETDEWHVYAADFAEKRGFRPIPTRYLDGRGNWFMRNGESDDQAQA